MSEMAKQLHKNIERNLLIYLNNYFIQNGSFKGISKINGRVYRYLLNMKKQHDPDTEMSLTEWLEEAVLYRMITPPRVKERLDINLYNALVNAVAVNVTQEVESMKHFPDTMLTGFVDARHMGNFEPAYLKFLEDRIPKYMGPLPEDSDTNLRVEGYKYWGPNLTEQCDFVSDLLAFFGGFRTCNYITPSIAQKLYRIIQKHGNLNFIGMDSMNTLHDLNMLTKNTRAKSISELLSSESIEFHPIEYDLNDNVVYVKKRQCYTVLLENDQRYEIVIGEELYKQLRKADLLQKIELQEQNTNRGVIPMMVITSEEYNNLTLLNFFTRDTTKWFKDGNPLNLRKENIL